MAKVKSREYQNRLFEMRQSAKPSDPWVTGGGLPWRYKPYGKERRAEMLKFLNAGGRLWVNRKWQLQTKYDMDLKRLLKKGLIRIQKAGMQSWVELV